MKRCICFIIHKIIQRLFTYAAYVLLVLEASTSSQPCIEINISLDIFDKYLSIYLLTKILRIFTHPFFDNFWLADF